MALNIISDPLGFPMIRMPGMDFYIHYFPVTKLQFERFISLSNKPGYGDRWYNEILSLNSRISHLKLNRENYEGAFISGVTPQEALDFVQWLGKGYRLPDIQQWRQAYKSLKSAGDIKMDFSGIEKGTVGYKFVKSMERSPGNLFELSFMKNGFAEWVQEKDDYCGLGSPRSSFHQNLNNPESENWVPFNKNKRIHFFSFRAIKETDN